jgi:hypothetical protein
VPEPLITVEDLSRGERVRLSPHSSSLPSRFRGCVDDPNLPYRVELTISFGGDRVVCEQLTCHQRNGAAPVTSAGMTHIRVADLVYQAAREALALSDSDGPAAHPLRAVGQIYALAYACGGSPRKQVMETLGLPRTTANRWIKRAREEGHL